MTEDEWWGLSTYSLLSTTDSNYDNQLHWYRASWQPRAKHVGFSRAEHLTLREARTLHGDLTLLAGQKISRNKQAWFWHNQNIIFYTVTMFCMPQKIILMNCNNKHQTFLWWSADNVESGLHLDLNNFVWSSQHSIVSWL